MTAALDLSPSEITGQMVAVWRPDGPDVVLAVETPVQERAALHISVLDELPRDPDHPQIVVLPEARYLVGQMHPTRPFTVYMHRL